jgi:hypothetical protein
MKIKNSFLLFSVLVITGILACTPDDDGPTAIVENDRTEQQLEDNQLLLEYLSTHYYNSSLFETPGNYTYSDIVITQLTQDEDGNFEPLPNPEDNTLLIDAVGDPFTVEFAGAEYQYYVLQINEGGGESPAFTDAVRVRYAGNLASTTGNVFDERDTPTELTLQGDGVTSLGAIKGWQLVMPMFKTAENFTIEDDGAVTFNNYGTGVMFLPSGLGYYANFVAGIPPYSNLVFKFDLLQYEVVDHDGDGVPSFLEDIDNSGEVIDDDTDGDGLQNFRDVDDDGDGVLTRFEDIDGDGDPTNDMSPVNPDLPRYLDPEATDSNQD